MKADIDYNEEIFRNILNGNLPHEPETDDTPNHIEKLLPRAILLPIHARQKGPIYHWRKINFAQSVRPRYRHWLSERANTGVVLGERSGNLCAIDVDNDQLLQEFVNLNPDLGATLCSKGARGGQFWLQMDGDYPHRVYKLKTKDGEKWGEWRADGGQSIIRGIHPNGCRYRLLCDAPPIKIRFDDIKWPPGLILAWKNPPAPVATTPASRAPFPTGDISERVRRYLEKVPASIEGNGGDDQLFKAASILVNGFALSFEEALPFLREYNARAEPPWPERRLVYKLTEALFNPPPDKPHGYLLVDSDPFVPFGHPSYLGEPEDSDMPEGLREALVGDDGSESPPFAKELEEEFGDPGGSEKPVEWEDGLLRGMCSSGQLATLDIKPPEPLVGDWLRVGDLGFVFAIRGVGKTWFAMDLAHAIAQHDVKPVRFGPWEVHRCVKIFYLDGEMPPGDIKARDLALGIATENLVYVNHEILFERTGLVMNLANPAFQKGVLALCEKQKFEVVVLDNLSTLSSGVDENKGLDWEIIQPWLLELRRRHITVILIHHGGRNNEMRGHSKREDPSAWIIRLDAPTDPYDKPGARFFTHFTKWRGATQKPTTYEWHYVPVGENDVCVEVREASPIIIFKHLIESGLTLNSDLAAEMEVTKGYISQLATKGKKEGWLEINGRKYTLK